MIKLVDLVRRLQPNFEALTQRFDGLERHGKLVQRVGQVEAKTDQKDDDADVDEVARELEVVELNQ